MTIADTQRRSLITDWRRYLFGKPAKPDTTTVTTEPEEATVGHIYFSDQPEPGQTTTAIGRHHTGEYHLVAPPEIPGDRTQVIRVEPKPDPAPVNPLGPFFDASETEDYDPPIYLATVAAVEKLRELPAADDTDQAAKEDVVDA